MRGGDPPRHPFWLFSAPGTRISAPVRFTPGRPFGLFPAPARAASRPPVWVLSRSARAAPRPPVWVTRHPRQPSFRCPLCEAPPSDCGRPLLLSCMDFGPPVRARCAPAVPLCSLGPLSAPLLSARCLSAAPPRTPPPPPGCAQSSPFPGKLDRPFFRRPPIPNPRSRRHLCRRLFPANPTDPFPSCPPPIPNPRPPLLSPLSCRRRFPATFLPSRSPTPTAGSPVPSFSLLSEKEGESREAFPRIFVSLQP